MTSSLCALVVLSVGTIGPLADLFHKKPIVPAYEMKKLQCCPKWRDRDNAAAALGRCDWRRCPEIVDALAAALLHDPDEDVRGEAAESLAKLAPCMPIALEAARQAANCDPDHGVRKWARKAAANMERSCRTPCRFCRDEIAPPPVIIRENGPPIIHEEVPGHHDPRPTMLNIPRPDPLPLPMPRSQPAPFRLPDRDAPQGIWPADEPPPAIAPRPSLEPPVMVPPPPDAPAPILEEPQTLPPPPPPPQPQPQPEVETPALPHDSSLGVLEPVRPRRDGAASIASRPARATIAPASAAGPARVITSQPAPRVRLEFKPDDRPIPAQRQLIIPRIPAPASISIPDEGKAPALEAPMIGNSRD